MVWVLTGFMGCGKTSVGSAAIRLSGKAASGVIPVFAKRKLSQKSSGPLRFIDLDEEIVRRCGRSIPEIFNSYGEAGFRAIERETLANLLQATGVPPEGRNTRGSIAGGPSRRDGGVSEANSRRGNDQQPEPLLISLGGGTLMDEGCRELVKEHCRCIYLHASVKTLAGNLRKQEAAAGRPLLAGTDPAAPADASDSIESRIKAMMAVRGPVYESAADTIIDTDGLSIEEIATKVLETIL